jgi:hypothetical protein
MATEVYECGIQCLTDGRYETAWVTADLSACPVLAGHTVVPASVRRLGTSYFLNTITATDSPYALGDAGVIADASSGDVTVNLPAAAGSAGATVMVYKTGASGTVTVDAASTELIDEAETKTLTADGDCALLQCDGAAWTTVTTAVPQVGADAATTAAVWGSQFQQAASDSEVTTTSTTYVQKLRLTTGDLPAGTYRIAWYYEYQQLSTTYDFLGCVRINGTTTAQEIRVEPSDDASTQWHPCGGVYYHACSGVQDIDIEYARSSSSGGTSGIRRARLEIWRVV